MSKKYNTITWEGVKRLHICLEPYLIDFAKSKGSVSFFINTLLKNARERELKDQRLDDNDFNSLGQLREDYHQLRKNYMELENRMEKLIFENQRLKRMLG